MDTANCPAPVIDLQRLDIGRLHDVRDDAHRRTSHFEPTEVEGHGHQRAFAEVHQMPGRDETRIRRSLDQHFPCSGRQRLCHDERVVP